MTRRSAFWGLKGRDRVKHYKLTIPGLLPGLNEYVDAERGAKGKYKAAAMKKQAENVIGYMIKTQLRGVRFTRPVVIHYTCYYISQLGMLLCSLLLVMQKKGLRGLTMDVCWYG